MDTAQDRYINRELSWVDFNARVLALAEDTKTPLLERAKFLAIFASNLDEFYMVRVAGLKRQIEAGVSQRSPDGLTPREQLSAIAEKAVPLAEQHASLFCKTILPALASSDINILRWDDIDEVQKKEMDLLFEQQIFPVVTPLAVDPSHPFPYISNLSLNLAVLVRDPVTNQTHFARVKVPPVLPRFVELLEGALYIPLEDVIASNLDKLFPGMEVVEHHTFRVTRNGDLELDDDEAEDLLQALEEELRKKRFSPAVRLEIEQSMPDHVLDLLMRELQIGPEDVHALPGPLDLAGLWDLYRLERPELKDSSSPAVTHPSLTGTDDIPADMFSVLKDQDVLVHHPYESFATSVQRFVEQAAADPKVLAIKQTLYRTSGPSAIVTSLAKAAQAGKQVVVLVELRARFDEQANIGWARTLEKAGCHVVYGVVGLKTHCKLCLVVRQEAGGLRRYVHVGTGNYNSKTAKLYEDIGLLTSDDRIGADVSNLFNNLTGYARRAQYKHLVVAPHAMRSQIMTMIERERTHQRDGRSGRIVLKINSLVDEDIIDALYAASSDGVQVDLIVRGICSLRPGVAGLSENIRVRSLLGRFLEHSRIFFFGNAGEPSFYIGSADLMRRNLDRRVEVLVRVDAPELQSELSEFLELQLSDGVDFWELRPNNRWERSGSEGTSGRDAQAVLTERITARAGN